MHVTRGRRSDELCDALFRNATQAKPAQHQGHVVGHPFEGGLGSETTLEIAMAECR